MTYFEKMLDEMELDEHEEKKKKNELFDESVKYEFLFSHLVFKTISNSNEFFDDFLT